MSATYTAERIRADVAELVGCAPDEIGPDDDLLDLGLDSMRIMSLVERWRRDGAAGLDFPDLAEEPVLTRWVQIVQAAADG